jgi:hypothetical protein
VAQAQTDQFQQEQRRGRLFGEINDPGLQFLDLVRILVGEVSHTEAKPAAVGCPAIVSIDLDQCGSGYWAEQKAT